MLYIPNPCALQPEGQSLYEQLSLYMPEAFALIIALVIILLFCAVFLWAGYASGAFPLHPECPRCI